MRVFRMFAVVLSSLVCVGLAAADEKKIQGKWQMEKIETGGMAVPADIAKGITLEITGAKFKLSGAVLVETIEAEFKLDVAKGEIDFTPTNGPEKGMTSKGLFKVTDDTLELCFGAPGVDRPKELKTAEGVKSFLWSAKKMK